MSRGPMGAEAPARPGPRVTARGALAAAGLAALVAFPIVRVSVADRTPLRSLGLAGLWFEKTAVDPGQTVTRELRWVPERDVYVVGWNPLLLAPAEAAYLAELTLADAATRIFVLGERRNPPADAGAWNPADLPPGTGYLVRAGRPLTLRFRIANHGEDKLLSQAAGAQIRYLPAG